MMIGLAAGTGDLDKIVRQRLSAIHRPQLRLTPSITPAGKGRGLRLQSTSAVPTGSIPILRHFGYAQAAAEKALQQASRTSGIRLNVTTPSPIILSRVQAI
jgi:hypothetical protein